MENVLTILTMCIKMYALGVTCPTSPLLNLDVIIFAEVIQKHNTVNEPYWWFRRKKLLNSRYSPPNSPFNVIVYNI